MRSRNPVCGNPKDLKAGSQRYLYAHVHNCIIHDSKNVKAAQVPAEMNG